MKLKPGNRYTVWYHSFSETLFTVDELESTRNHMFAQILW